MSRTVYQSPSTSRVDGVYPSVNQALSLLERMDVVTLRASVWSDLELSSAKVVLLALI